MTADAQHEMTSGGVQAVDSERVPDDRKGTAAEQIVVRKFELILLFPFALVDESATERDINGDRPRGAGRLNDWRNRITREQLGGHKVWEELVGKFPDPDGRNPTQEFAEWVYFHPFIRSFLYDSPQDRKDHEHEPGKPIEGKSVRILKRLDVAEHGSLAVTFWSGALATVLLDIKDVQLYLFDTGVGMLAIRLVMGDDKTLSLKQALNLQDCVRRLYAPHFEKKLDIMLAGHCPEQVALQRAGHADLVSYHGTHRVPTDAGFKAFREHIHHVSQHCEPYTAEVWRELLWPLAPREIKSRTPSPIGLRFEHIVDDRMPIMSYLAVDKPREITVGDWMRLATVDDAGDSYRYPYSPEFARAEALNPFAYDRFWAQSTEPPAQEKHATRWLTCGYGFTSVGPADDKEFFTNEQAGALAHFRYHYFKLVLIAHFHRASLLRFKQRLADAVECLQQKQAGEDERMARFERTLTEIQLDLLAFRNMYWFTEVTGQLQGQELFDLISKHLRTRELFTTIFEESEKAAEIVVGWNRRKQSDNQRLQAENQREQSDGMVRIYLIATLLVLIQPLLALFTPDAFPLWARMIAPPFLTLGFLLVMLVFSKYLTELLQRIIVPNWVAFFRKLTPSTIAVIAAAVLVFLGIVLALIGWVTKVSNGSANIHYHINVQVPPPEKLIDAAKGAKP